LDLFAQVFDYDPEQAENTPYRAKNYNELNELVTNLAFESVRIELHQGGEVSEVAWLEWYFAQTEGMSAFERLQRLYASFEQV
jgi:hypothetical protein